MKPTITLEIVSVIREFDLETQKEATRMKCRLPVTGDEVILPVDTDYLQEMIAASATKGAEEEEPRKAQDEWRLREEEPEEEEPRKAAEAVQEDDDVLNWKENPSIPNRVKIAMMDYGLPDVLPRAKVEQIVPAILEGYSDEDWKALGKKYGVVLDRPPVVRASTGGVSWGEGVVMSPSESRPSRTVPSDSKGNPVVPQRAGAVDPGAISVPVDDDDVASF